MSFFVRRMRLELTRSCDHYPLKVACIPISPPAREHFLCPEQDSNLHTSRHAHLKRTRLPIPPSGQKKRADELFPQSFYYKSKINAFNFRKRVQRYCFFLTYANFSAFFLHFFAFSVILFCACARPFLIIIYNITSNRM